MNQVSSEQQKFQTEIKSICPKKKIMKWTGSKKSQIHRKSLQFEQTDGSKFIIRRARHGNIIKLIGKHDLKDQQNSKSTEGSISEIEISEFKNVSNQNEIERIDNKILRIRNYWNSYSLMIPNVFRVLSYLEDDTRFMLEYQDLSKKEVLVTSGGSKSRIESEDFFEINQELGKNKKTNKNCVN